jgi:FlgD Ig-like domain
MWRTLSVAMVLASALLAIVVSPSPGDNNARAEAARGPLAERDESLHESPVGAGILEVQGRPDADCSRTTEALARACGNEVKDDFWVAYAQCLNITDEDEREDCFADADEERLEALHLCREQEESRAEVCDLLGEAAYDPEIDPDDFLSPEETSDNPNPYFPLVPGTSWKYESEDETTEVTVTDDTIEILGIECFVVKDVVRENGEVIEDTDDWFAQDKEGNVWYFGEISMELEDGVIASLEGSWKSGEDGAKPGIIMKASPKVGDVYRQEFFLGDAEDLAEVISLTGDEEAPAAACDGQCVVTRDFTPIEPGHEEHKHYAPGVGLILEVADSGERNELVKFTPGSPLLGRMARPEVTASSRSAVPVNLELDAPSLGSIRFVIQRDADVTADVYDPIGRKVRSLASGPHRAGVYTIAWDGTDSQHRRVAAGVYFVRVVAADQSAARKLLVVR